MSINEIPIEILQSIFELVVGKPSRFPSKQPGSTSLQVLCSVCRVWYDVVLQDSLLWRTIHFTPAEAAIEQCERALKRSAGAPLDIYINKLFPYTDRSSLTKAYGKRFLELIGAAAYRWRTVSLNIPDLTLELEPLWSGKTPALESLSIALNSPWPSSSTPVGTAVLPGYSNLTSLTVAKFSLDWDKWSCSSITQLSLGPFAPVCKGPSTRELCGILQTLSETLSSLTMKGQWYTPRDIREIIPPPITLSHLKLLNISSGLVLHVQQVLRACRFPVLENVEIHFGLLRLLSPDFAALLCEEPPLLRSTKRVTFGFAGPTPISLGAALQRAFPRVESIHLAPYTPLDLSIIDFLSASWDTLTHLVLAEAGLPEVKDLLSARFRKYATPLQGLTLLVARDTLYRVDYEWIRSHVHHFTIVEVRIDAGSYTLNRVRSAFDERLLVAQAPAQRPPAKPLQVRAL